MSVRCHYGQRTFSELPPDVFQNECYPTLTKARAGAETQDTVLAWSLTSLREKLVKIGAKVVRHGRHVTFQLAEGAVPRQMFAGILSLIARLRAPLAPA
jgi:hypothetical protein